MTHRKPPDDCTFRVRGVDTEESIAKQFRRWPSPLREALDKALDAHCARVMVTMTRLYGLREKRSK